MSMRQRTDLIWKYLAVAIFSTSIITACGSDSESPVESITSPPRLSILPLSGAALSEGQNISPGRFVRNALYLMELEFQKPREPSVPSAPDGGGSSADNYSTTNAQIQGVDEADRIEYNGDYLFVANVPIHTENTDIGNQVRVLERLNDFSLREATTIPLPSEFIVAGMYLNSDTLSVVSQTHQYYSMDGALQQSSEWRAPDNDTIVDVYDVATPASPNSTGRIRIDGGLINSRRIGDSLYIATQYVPNVSGLPRIDYTDQSRVDLYKALLNTDDSDLVPHITINGQSSELFQL